MLMTGLCSLSQTLVYNVTFKINTPGLPDSSIVYIAGGDPALGNWNPSKVALEKFSADTWGSTFKLKHNQNVEYKITLGSWDKEAVDSIGKIPPNSVIRVLKDTTVSRIIKHWSHEFDSNYEIEGQITGEVRYHNDIKFEPLLPRDIIVWLPPGYHDKANLHYPVLYMHDGQNVFDPATSPFGIDWQVDEAADSLIRNDIIDRIIIVGIYNTPDRSTEYDNTLQGQDYMKFVVDKVKPLVDKTYRTKPEREFTAVGGSSMGGLISFMLVWEHNQVFSKAICMSPAFKYKDNEYISAVEIYSGPKKTLTLYIDNGGVGLEEQLQPGVDEMIKVLKQKDYIEDNDFVFYLDKDGVHNEGAWAKRIPNALKFLFGTK
jgi:predicted alpha/beta superfamily hydrolase